MADPELGGELLRASIFAPLGVIAGHAPDERPVLPMDAGSTETEAEYEVFAEDGVAGPVPKPPCHGAPPARPGVTLPSRTQTDRMGPHPGELRHASGGPGDRETARDARHDGKAARAPQAGDANIPARLSARVSHLMRDPLTFLNLLLRNSSLEAGAEFYLTHIDGWYRYYSAEIDRSARRMAGAVPAG